MYSDPENDVETLNIEEQHEVEQPQNSGDEDNEGAGNDGDKDEEGGEDKAKKVVKTKRIIRNPQPKLNADTLKGARGLTALPALFAKQKFKGKHHEKEDVRALLKTYAYWCHRMFPKYPFEECVEKIEKLGYKKPVMTYIKKIRMGLVEEENNEILPESDEEESQPTPSANTDSQFDKLLGIPPALQAPTQLSDDQIERIRINKEKALQLRQARLKRIQQQAELKLLPSLELPGSESQQTPQLDSHMEVNESTSNEDASINISTLTASLDNAGASNAVQNNCTDITDNSVCNGSQENVISEHSETRLDMVDNSSAYSQDGNNTETGIAENIDDCVDASQQVDNSCAYCQDGNTTENGIDENNDYMDASQQSMIIGQYTRKRFDANGQKEDNLDTNEANNESSNFSQESNGHYQSIVELPAEVDKLKNGISQDHGLNSLENSAKQDDQIDELIVRESNISQVVVDNLHNNLDNIEAMEHE